jgi:hypothetical protein
MCFFCFITMSDHSLHGPELFKFGVNVFISFEQGYIYCVGTVIAYLLI